MAKIRRSLNIEFPDELGALLTAVGNHVDEITEKAFQAGAEAVLPIFRENLKASIGNTKFESRSTGELVESVGISPFMIDNKGNPNIKIGFNEPRSLQYLAVHKRSYYLITNAMIANVLEYGKHGQPPRPWLTRTKAQAKDVFLQAAQQKFEEEIDKL